MSRFLGYLALVLVLLPASCFAQDPGAGGYLLGPGDLVRMTVYEHPDLTLETLVSEAGNIRVPMIGEVHAGGNTVAATEDLIAKRLIVGAFIKNPTVFLVVTEYRSQQITMLGHVQKPGKYPLQVQSRVLDMVAMAGGVSATGADAAVLVRKDGTRVDVDFTSLMEAPDQAANVLVHNGDTVFVKRAPTFYIHGEVQRPGAYRIEHGMTVMQALTTAGGLSARGTRRGMTIMHPAKNGEAAKTTANLDQLVRPDDVIYVKESLF